MAFTFRNLVLLAGARDNKLVYPATLQILIIRLLAHSLDPSRLIGQGIRGIAFEIVFLIK